MKTTKSVLLIASVLIIANSLLFAQAFRKHIENKSEFTFDGYAKTNVLPEKKVIANNHKTVNYLSEFKGKKFSQAMKFSNISTKPTFDFTPGDLKGKNNILTPKPEGRKFSGKKNWFLPSNKSKTDAWKIK